MKVVIISVHEEINELTNAIQITVLNLNYFQTRLIECNVYLTSLNDIFTFYSEKRG